MIDNARLRTELKILPSGERAVVAFIRCERITDFDVPALTSDLTSELETLARHLVADLSEVHLMGSCGLSLLLTLKRTCEARGGRLVLCGLNEDLVGMLRVTSLLKLFRVEASLDAAVASVG